MIVTGQITVTIVDDAPTVFTPDHGLLLNKAGATWTGKLDVDGDITRNLGADGGIIKFPASLNGAQANLTSGGLPITYSVINGGLSLVASTAAGEVFRIELHPDGSPALSNDTYTVTMTGTIDGGADHISFNSGIYTFNGGNTAWKAFTTLANDGSADLLLTPIGSDGQTINGNANSVGVGGGDSGQSIAGNEGIRLDFVRDVLGNPSSGGSGYQSPGNRNHTFDDHYTTNGATVKVGGSNSNTKIQFAAFDDTDTDNTVGNGTRDSINAFAITFGGQTQIVTFVSIGTTATPVNAGGRIFTVQFVDLDPTSGVKYGVEVIGANSSSSLDGVSFSTYTADGYNSLEIRYVSGGSFVLTDFGTSSIQPGNPVNVDVPVQLVDSDGDTVGSTIGITLTPSGQGVQDSSGAGAAVSATSTNDEPHIIGSDFDDTLNGNGGANVLSGGGGNDTINGNGGDDVLIGGAGNDILSVGDGKDILIGGAGQDTLTGGAAADAFVLDNLDIKDLIADFSGVGGQGDVIDLTALFDTNGGDVADFVNYDAATKTLSVDVDGTGGGAGFVQVATFNNSPAASTITLLYDNGANEHTTTANNI